MTKDSNPTANENWIILKGITAYGKKYIQKHGSKWFLEKNSGHRLMIRSRYKTFKIGRDWHDDDWTWTITWVNVPNDKNFEILVSTLYQMPK